LLVNLKLLALKDADSKFCFRRGPPPGLLRGGIQLQRGGLRAHADDDGAQRRLECAVFFFKAPRFLRLVGLCGLCAGWVAVVSRPPPASPPPPPLA